MQKHLLSGYLFYTLFSIFLTSGKTLACTGEDVVFTSITVTSISSGNYQCSYQIQNIGTVDIPFNQLVIQNYVSANNTYDVSDQAAGGSYINNASSGTLAAGATYNGTMTVYSNGNSQSSYPYIVSHVYLSVDTECDATNNYFGVFIQVTGITSSFNVANATVNWNTDNKSFTVSEWTGNYAALQYSVYTSSGILVLSGSTKKNESTPLLNLNKGVYLLYLSDEEKIYFKKIMY